MDALVLGLSIGLAAGISPGPLLVLVVTATLRSGARAGVLTACAPLVTDALVVTAVLLVLDQLPPDALAVIGVAGGVFVVWTGVSTLRESRVATLRATREERGTATRTALRQAAVVNLLSPHPWVTWASALGPLAVTTWRGDPAGGIGLVVGFYLTLVGAKVAAALLVARGRRRLTDRGYRRSLVGAGVLLVLAGFALGAEFLAKLW